ncbi:MAG: tRNA guanosine(34) transglycosylase Tgt [Planctomycetota bacterium]
MSGPASPAPSAPNSSALEFSVSAQCAAARAGELHSRGRTLLTPAFLPVGTYGSVKGLFPDQLRALGAGLLLANTCHLEDRPGSDVVAELGGLHRVMNWDGLLLTDSGGFQVFSLMHTARIDEEGVTFRSPIDGRALRLGPREAVAIQSRLNSDIAMTFDDCPPLPSSAERLAAAVERTLRWAASAREAHRASAAPGQAQFAIVQGGLDDRLRERCAEGLRALDFDGYAVGGLSVGESSADLQAALARYAGLLPTDQPRYAMGIGRPADVLAAIAAGFDMFDSVLPTRNGRHGAVFTAQGTLQLRNHAHRLDREPIEADCDCPACCGWSRGALRHLLMSDEPLGRSLCSAHNLRHLHRLVERARQDILAGRFSASTTRPCR